MTINFPNNPSNGQTYTYNGITYSYQDPPGVWIYENLFGVTSGGSGDGLSVGGTIEITRTFSLDINSLTEDISPESGADYVATYDASTGLHKKVLLGDLPGGGGGGSGGVTNHGALTGLSDDDHNQYSLADGSRWTDTPTANRVPISDGSGNLVVSNITTSELNHLDGVTSAIQTQLNSKADTSHNHSTADITSGTFADARIAESNVTQHEAAIDHNALTNFVGNEHVDHSSVTITAGDGLSGGGDLTVSRTIDLDFNSLTTENSLDSAVDTITFYDNSAGEYRKTVIDNLGLGGGGGGGGGLSNAYVSITDGTTTTSASGSDTFKFRTANNLLTVATQSNDATHGDNVLFTINEGLIDHGNLTGLSDDDHTQYSLADGSRWTTTPTINRAVISNASGNLVVSLVTSTELGYLSGVTSAIQTQLDSKASTSHNHAASDITSGTFADARIAESNVTQHESALDHDALTNFVGNEHIDHTSVTLTTGEGLTGGGDISSNRTFSLDVNGLTADASPVASTDYVLTYDSSAGDHKKVLLDDLPGGGGGSVITDSDDITEGTTNLFLTTVERTQIGNTETTTQLNTRDTNNRDRANHTGTQLMATISDAGNLATLNSVDTAQVADDAITVAKILDSDLSGDAGVLVTGDLSTQNSLVKVDSTGNLVETNVSIGSNDDIVGLRAPVDTVSGGTYNLLIGDCGKVITFTNGSSVTLTVPTGLGVGFNCTIVQKGTGQITFVPSGTTINHPLGHTKSYGQHATVGLVSDVADNFYLSGDTNS